MKKWKLKGIKPIDLFLIVSLFITIIFLMENIITKGALFEKCVLSSSFLFSDYFYHIAGSSDTSIMYSYGDPYSFPPFAYFMYSLLWSMNPYKDSESILNWQNYRNADNALVVFVVYNMLLMMLLIYCIDQYFYERNVKYNILLPTALLMSYPFLCTSVQRGNVVILVAILLALAWVWIDSENRWKQEFALFFIAFSAGFKLYPALIGILYVKRKDWKKVARLLAYGVVVTFVPFIFFGGFNGIQGLFHTLTRFASTIDSQKFNTVCGFAKWFGEKVGMNASTSDTFAVTINCLFFVASIIFFFLSRKKWQEALFLNGILVSFIPSNWEYTLVYYLPVLFLFLREYNNTLAQNNLKENISIFFHTIAFALVFSVDFFMLYYRYGLISGIFTVTYLVIVVNMVEIFINRYINLRKKKQPASIMLDTFGTGKVSDEKLVDVLKKYL